MKSEIQLKHFDSQFNSSVCDEEPAYCYPNHSDFALKSQQGHLVLCLIIISVQIKSRMSSQTYIMSVLMNKFYAISLFLM